jgi:hypothetical protein
MLGLNVEDFNNTEWASAAVPALLLEQQQQQQHVQLHVSICDQVFHPRAGTPSAAEEVWNLIAGEA